jgi:hypothetical protein
MQWLAVHIRFRPRENFGDAAITAKQGLVINPIALKMSPHGVLSQIAWYRRSFTTVLVEGKRGE